MGVHIARTEHARGDVLLSENSLCIKRRRRTYSGKIAIQHAKNDDAGDRVHTDHSKEDDAAAKRGDDRQGGDVEVSDEDGRAKLTDKARGVHDHELFVDCLDLNRWGWRNKRNRVERKRVPQAVPHSIELEIKQGIVKRHDKYSEAAHAGVK